MNRRRIGAALVGLATLVATLDWHRVFGWGPMIVIVAAAVLPALFPIGMTFRATELRPVALSAGVSAAILVIFLVVLAGLADLAEATVNGWSRLLTTTLPVPDRGDLLVTPVAIAWVACLVGSELTLRVRRPLVGLLPPLGAYGVALVYSAGEAGDRMAGAVGLALISLLMGFVCAPDADGAPTSRKGAERDRARTGQKALGAAVVIVVSLVGGLILGPRLPMAGSDSPYDPRAEQKPPVQDLEVIDPMSMLAGWALGTPDDEVLFTVRAPDAEPFQRWRLAVLDRYEARSGWSVDTPLTAAGGELPTSPDGPPKARDLDQAITIGDLQGPWLPAADRPQTVEGVDAFVDPDSGVLATADGLAPALRYDVVSTVPVVAPDCTLAAAGELTAADLETPVEPDLADLASRITAGATSPCERAKQLETYLTGDAFKFSNEAFSGAALRNVRTLLGLVEEGEELTAPAGVGTSEQYATAYALLARAVGLPARVVVGFRAGERTGDLWQVRPLDGYAWVEIRFADLGWVAFDPTPQPGDQPPQPELPEEEAVDDGTTANGGGTGAIEGEPPVDPDAKETPSGLRQGAVAVGLFVLVTTVALGAVALLVSLRRRRRYRRRRSAADPTEQVIGAWRECIDELRDAGVRPARSASARECVTTSELELGHDPAAHVRPIARLFNTALFSSESLGEDHAAQAWDHVDQLVASTAKARTPAAKAKRALDVRVLVRS
jgi:transglutaminase-like putative cysteine protease